MRRILITIICLLLLSAAVLAADAQITALDTKCTVSKDGSIEVTATAEVTFSAPTESLLFPLGKEAGDITVQGRTYQEEIIDGVTCLRITGTFSGEQSFVCSYTLPCGVENNDSGQKFCLHLPESGWEYAIEKYTLQVTFPVQVESTPQWQSGYYNDVIDNYLTIGVTENTVTAQSTAQMRDHETITMTVQFPTDTFDLRNQPGKTASVDQILFFALFIAAIIYWFFLLRGALVLPKLQQSIEMEATAGETACQMFGQTPDAFGILAHWGNLGYLTIYRNSRGRILLRKQMEMGNERKPSERKFFNAIFRESDVCDAQSLRFHNAQKTMRVSVRSGWNRRMFVPKSGNPSVLRAIGVIAGGFVSLLVFDKLLPAIGARWFFLPLLTLLGAAMCVFVQRGVCAFYRRRRALRLSLGAVSAVGLLILGGAANCSGLMLLNLLLQCFCALTTLFGAKRTEAGNDRLRRLLGLRTFLRRADQGALQRLTYLDPQYFFCMLPFAEQLGVGRPFSKHFGRIMPEACAWLSAAKITPSTHLEFYQLYEEMASAVRGEYYRKTGYNAGRKPRNRPLQSVAPSGTSVRSTQQRPHRRTEYDE